MSVEPLTEAEAWFIDYARRRIEALAHGHERSDAHDCDRCGASGFLILDRVARATGELIDVECPRCRGTGTVR